MAWCFGSWQDFLKKKACRYILQHYLGQFLKEKLSLDQLSLDLYNGMGNISELNLDVQAINDDLTNLNIPVELVDGFIERISVSIPWASLIQDSTRLEVTGLELTLRPKDREDKGMMAGEMFSSMQSSMTTSLQLAKDCLESEKGSYKTEPIEGVQKFALMIDSVLSKVRVSLTDTVVRLEHHPETSPKGVALEIRIKRVEYFDDMATVTVGEGSSVDGNVAWEPAAINQKNLHIEGVQIYFDEITSRRAPSRSRSSSTGSPSQLFTSAQSSLPGSLHESEDQTTVLKSASQSSSPFLESEPIQVAVLTGRQEVKLKTKQNDTLQGPKLEILCQFGGLHILLSPRQLHGIIELFSGLTTPAPAEGPHGQKPETKSKPMDPFDFQRVEVELQQQLQSGRLHSNQAHDLHLMLPGEADDHFYSLMSPGRTSGDMESSLSSTYSCSTNRTVSTVPSSTAQSGQSKSTGKQKDPYTSPKYHEDPSAELSHYQVRVAFVSVTLLHNNPTSTPDVGGVFQAGVMREPALKFFQRVSGIGVAGLSELKEVRKQFAELVLYDHLRLLLKPLNLECHEKAAIKQLSLTVHLTAGMLELMENLYDRRTHDQLPEVTELLVFHKDVPDTKKSAMYSSMHGGMPSMYSSMHGGMPCLTLDLTSVAHKSSSRPDSIPHTNINVSLGAFEAECDVTIVDRITNILTPDKIVTTLPMAGLSMYHTVGDQFYSITQTLDEGTAQHDQRITIQVLATTAKLNLRFPIPDLRQVPHVDKSWWQRNLREEILSLELSDARFQTEFLTSQSIEQLEFTCSDIHGYFKMHPNEDGQHFAHVTGDGGDVGFDRPRLVVKFCNNISSILEDESFSEDNTPVDSLNGACQFAKSEPSPFSTRRHMYGKEQESTTDRPNGETVSEEMVIPADKEELREFQERSTNNSQMVLDICLPCACLFIPNKHFFEVLYNRINGDLLLWEPTAPSPVTTQDHMIAPQQVDLNVYNQFLAGEHFELAKSGIQYDSDSDSDTDVPHYSIHDSRYPRRKKPPRQLPSKMCVNLSIGKGRLTAYTDTKDDSGAVMTDRHGEILVAISDFLLFTVANHNGDPKLQYLNILANRADLYHQASVDNQEQLPLIDCQELSAPVPAHLQHNKTIYRSEDSVLVTSRDDIGIGAESMDMISVAVKIRFDTMASSCDLTCDEKVKEFTVSVGVRGATMRYKMSQLQHSVFTQLLDFLDVTDYPILGYVEPKVLTELHVHLWTCAIDYRPLYLPVRSILTADSFSITSNIVAESSMTVLRFVLEDGSLFLSKKLTSMRTDLRKDYVCVADIGRLELLLKSYEGKDQRYPKTDLRVSTNRINLRTCADSCSALIDLIKYLASDGDLQLLDEFVADGHTDTDTDVSITTDDGDIDASGEPAGLPLLSTSSMDHVHNMMSDAMLESDKSLSNSETPSPETSTTNRTEVFFVPDTGQPIARPSATGLSPIVISASVDSVTSSTMSDNTDEFSDAEDDFCIIDDPGWGKAPRDGEPTIRVFAPIEIKDNYFSKPIGRTDILKSPDHFPQAESRYTLKELTLVWYMYGGQDFTDWGHQSSGEGVRTYIASDKVSMSYHAGAPSDRWSGHAAGREVPLMQRETLQTRGGPGRDHCKCMELQLTKVRFQYDQYPANTEQASRQVLLIYDIEVRDRLKASKINKFLYQYSSEDMPKQTYANMLLIKALHRRPVPNLPEEECSLKVSLQPIRLNIDQDALFFLKGFIMDLMGKDTADSPQSTPSGGKTSPPSRPTTTSPPPVMTVKRPESDPGEETTQDLLMQFDEITQDLQASLRGSIGGSQDETASLNRSSSSNASSGTAASVDSARSNQPVFFKSFVFSPDVPIRLDYHGKFDRKHGTLAGFGGLVSLNRSELKLKRLSHKQGLLGGDKLVSYCLNEWLMDIKVNQLPNILGGFGPMHSFVQLAHGIKDLFWLPVEQYKKDGRIVRGLQRGATSFSTSTAMSMLELTNRVVQSVQWCAELTFDMVSPGPRRRGFYPKQPADLREGVTNAYIVLREGFSDTASNIVNVATKEHEQKGIIGAVGGVLRQIPPTIVQPLIIVPEAASNLLGGLRSQLKPDARREEKDKWKEEIID